MIYRGDLAMTGRPNKNAMIKRWLKFRRAQIKRLERAIEISGQGPGMSMALFYQIKLERLLDVR